MSKEDNKDFIEQQNKIFQRSIYWNIKSCSTRQKTMSDKGNAKHTTKPSSSERMGNNKTLAEELHKPAIKKFNKRKVYSQFRDNIWE